MKFLLDESSHLAIASFLRDRGHDVKVVIHDYPQSFPDKEILDLARAEDRVLITNDGDFGGLVFRQGLDHAGVIFLRLPGEALEETLHALALIVDQHADDLRTFIVVSRRGGIRIRRR